MTDSQPTPEGTPPEGTPESSPQDVTDPAGAEAPAGEAAPQASGESPAEGHSFGDAAAEMANETEVEGADGGTDGEPADELALAQVALAERTADLQRLQAEYANYRKRVERDRQVVAENATYTALVPIIEVLDTIDRAREHGELDDGFKAVADQLERIVSGLGLTRYGAVGDEFDHNIHDALSHIGEDPDVTVTTCKVIAKSGYKIGDRVVRPAQVLVVDPPA